MSEYFEYDYEPDNAEDDIDIVCKFCDEAELHWADYGSGWRLYDTKDKRHVCKKVASVDDFDAL